MQDSVVICMQGPTVEPVCRYFPYGRSITFYNTLYDQQDYSRRLLIHNTGDIPLEIDFERFEAAWTLQPGESKMITPYGTDGADDAKGDIDVD